MLIKKSWIIFQDFFILKYKYIANKVCVLYSEENNNCSDDEQQYDEGLSKSTITIVVVCFFIFVFLLFSLLFFKSKSSKREYRELKTERPNPVNKFSALGIAPKIPVYRVGERFKFEISREIDLTGDMHNIVLKMKLPEDVPNRQRLFNISVSPAPDKIEKKQDGTYVIMNLNNFSGKKIVKISGEAQVRTYTLEIAQRINKNIDGELSPEDREKYLREELHIDTNSRLVRSVAKTKIPTATNDVDTVKNIFDFVVNNLRYDIGELNKDKGALAALQSGTGVCEEFADLFVTLCRVKGIPAKVVNGFDLPFQNDNFNDMQTGHAWAEVWFDQYGWVTFDASNNLNRKFRDKMEKLKITPYDALSGLTIYRTFLIADVKTVSINYEGKGNIVSRNLGIICSKI